MDIVVGWMNWMEMVVDSKQQFGVYDGSWTTKWQLDMLMDMVVGQQNGSWICLWIWQLDELDVNGS